MTETKVFAGDVAPPRSNLSIKKIKSVDSQMPSSE